MCINSTGLCFEKNYSLFARSFKCLHFTNDNVFHIANVAAFLSGLKEWKNRFTDIVGKLPIP